MSLSQGDVGSVDIDHDDYIPMSPEPRLHYMVDASSRCTTPDSKSLMDTKKSKVQKPKMSIWKRGKKKLSKWASNGSLDGKKDLDEDITSINDGSILDQELDYVDMQKLNEDNVDPENKSLSSCLDEPMQNLYNTPRAQFSTTMPLPPKPVDAITSAAVSDSHPGLLRHSYEEAVIKPKPASADTQSLTPSTTLSSDEEIFQLLKEREKYQSISPPFPLDKLLENWTLPQFLRVTRGFYTDNEDESLSDGDLLVAYCVKARDSVAAENPTGTKFSIPLNSHLKFVVCPPDVSQSSELLSMSTCLYKTVAELAELPSMPKIVRTTQDYTGQSEDESVTSGTLLVLEAMAKHDNSIVLAAKDLKGKEYSFREDCQAGFSTAVTDTWLFLNEIHDNLTFPIQVFIVTNEMLGIGSSLSAEINSLTSHPLTLMKAERGKYLVASSDITGDHCYNSDYIMEIPLNLDVEVECVTNPDRDHTEALKAAARAIYQQIKMKPGHLISQESMGEDDRELQEELYGSVSDFEYLRQVRSDRSFEVANPSYASWEEATTSAGMRKSNSSSQVSGSSKQPVPLPRTAKRNSMADTLGSNVPPPANEERYSLHLLRANRPLPPPPPSGSSETSPPQNFSQDEDLYKVPTNMPAQNDRSARSDESDNNKLYVNRGNTLKPRPLARGSVPNFEVGKKYRSLDGRRRSDPAQAMNTVRTDSKRTSPARGSEVAMDNGVEPIVMDLRQKIVILENRMSALLPGASQNGPLGPGGYKELEKELARVRTRQIRLEARVSEYDDKIQALSTKVQQLEANITSDDKTKANMKELLSLNVQQVGKLLVAMRLERYQNEFVRRRIDGTVLSFLTHEALDEMKVSGVDQAHLMAISKGLKSPQEILKENVSC
jgi:hypothetical protein